MKIAVIGLKEKWSSEELKKEIENLGHQSEIIDMQDIIFDMHEDRVLAGDIDLATFDAIIIKKLGAQYSYYLYDRLEALEYLYQKKNIPFFPAPSKIRRLINRLGCTNELFQNGIKIPETIVTENIELALEKLNIFGEAIVKPLFTSKSRGMIKISSDADARESLENFKDEFNTIYLQKVVQHPGYDLGVCFMGEEYIGTYARVGNKDGWNTTTKHGGHYEAREPNEEIISLARKSRDVFDLAFTCVDVVETQEGPMVFEVSAFGGFKGLLEAKGLNIAAMYAKHVTDQLKGSK